MSSSRFVNLISSSSLRCQSNIIRGIPRKQSYAFARGFRKSAINRRTVQQSQSKPPTNDAETLKALDALQALAHKTNIDVWSQPVETLGEIRIEHPASLLSNEHRRLDYTKLVLEASSSIYHRPLQINSTVSVELGAKCSKVFPSPITDDSLNSAVQSMYLIAKENAFPGIQVKSGWSPQIFRARSGPWLAGLRSEAKEVYTSVNEAVAT